MQLTTRQQKIQEATRTINFSDLGEKLRWIAHHFDIGMGIAFFDVVAIERGQRGVVERFVDTWT